MKSMRKEKDGSIEGLCLAQKFLVVKEQRRAQPPRLHRRIKVHMVLIENPLGARQQAHKVRPELNG